MESIKERITKSQAIVIYALWKNCSQEKSITLEDGFCNTNKLACKIEETEFTWDKYLETVEELAKLHSLKFDETGIWLCECISKEYW